MDYLPLLIKASVDLGGAYSKSIAYQDPFDTKEAYGLWIKHTPFTILPKAKGLVTQTWNDEDGDDVFLSTGSPAKCEAYDWKCDFIYLENDGMAHVRISEFVNRIRGRWLKIHDSYTNTTRDSVYVSEFDQEPKFKRRGNKDYVVFSITFRVNNPNFDEVF
jgi:hypothetical protein